MRVFMIKVCDFQLISWMNDCESPRVIIPVSYFKMKGSCSQCMLGSPTNNSFSKFLKFLDTSLERLLNVKDQRNG